MRLPQNETPVACWATRVNVALAPAVICPELMTFEMLGGPPPPQPHASPHGAGNG